MFQFKGTEKVEELRKFVKDELEDRLEALEHALLKRLAEEVIEEIKEKIPEQGLLSSYRDAIKLASVKDDTTVAVAIVADVPADLETVRNSREMAIYFPLLGGGLDEPAFPILHKNEPWTFDQVPPVSVKQSVVIRKLSEDEISGIGQARAAQRDSVIAELKRNGVPIGTEFKINGKAQLDLSSLAMRAEFGGPGSVRYPHWRPAIARCVRGMTFKKVVDDREFMKLVEKTLTDPSFRDWRRELNPLDLEITPQDVESFHDFAKMVSP